MFIVDGTFKGQSIPEGTCFIMTKEYGSTDKSLYSGKYGYVNLRNNIISADVVSQESATGGGVQGAASGAVLGFLIAGPVGTVLGAGLGSKKKGMDNVMIAITFANGDSWVVDRVEPKELGALKRYSASTIVRQPKKISSSSTKRKTVTKKRTTQLTIKKPKKPPTWDFDLKRVKGRKSSDKSKLPELPFLSKWKNIDGCDEKATKIFNINLSNEVQKYNNFKWIYFDRNLESENEVNLIAKQILKNLIVQSNKSTKLKDNTVELGEDLKSLENELKESNSVLRDREKELSEAGFLSRGGIKKQINIIQEDIRKTKSLITKNKRSITSIKKKFDSSKDIRSIEDPSNEFVSIFSKVLPDSKKPKNNLKVKKAITDQFFLDTYRKAFDEIWDKKIEEEENRIKEEEKKKKIQKAKKTDIRKKPESSTKEKLLELKELLDEELITKEEYEESRKRLLSNI